MTTRPAVAAAFAAAILLVSGVAAQEPQPAAPPEPPDPDWTVADNQPCLIWNHVTSIDSQSYTWSGGCVDGKASGEGALTYVGTHHVYYGSRYTYEGGMKAGKRHGYGTLVAASAIYEGEWRDGRENGHGTLTFRHSRTRYEGEFLNGARHGYGILTRSDGRRYEGEWCLDYRHGHGTKILEGGLALTCTWHANGAVAASCTVHPAPPPSLEAPAQRTDFHKETCSYEQVIAPLLR